MRQFMPGDSGWVDRGPRRHPRDPKRPPAEARLIIKRGEEDPRLLTPDQQSVANRNRVAADGDLAAIEKWAKDGCTVPEGKR